MAFGFRFKIILFSCILVLATNAVTAYLFKVEIEESRYQASIEHLPKAVSKVVSDLKTELGSVYSNVLRLAQANFTAHKTSSLINGNNPQKRIQQKQRLVSTFSETLKKHDAIVSISLIDMENLGQEITSVTKAEDGKISERPLHHLNSYLKNKTFGDTVNLEPGHALITLALDESKPEKKLIQISTPVVNANQNAIGVLIASLDLTVLVDGFFKDNHSDILFLLNHQHTIIHQSSQLTDTIISQANGLLNSASISEKLYRDNDDPKTSDKPLLLAQHAQSTTKSSSFIWTNEDISLRHLAAPNVADQLTQIKLVLMQPYQSQSFNLSEIHYIWGITIVAILLFTYLLSLAFSISLISPLNKIIEATKLFAEQGYIFEDRLPLKSKDETGAIAKAFVELFDRVENNYLHLDDTIRELVISQTKEIKRNTELKEAIEKSDQDHQLKYKFLSKVSREIRTPLNGIIGSLQLLEDHTSCEEDLTLITDAKSSTNHLLKLLNDLIDASNLENNTVQILKAPFSLNEMLKDIPMIISNLREEKSATLNINSLEDFQTTLLGDVTRLQQIIINILALAFNQCKAQATISLSLRMVEESDDHIVIKFSIKDSSGGEHPSNLINLKKLLDKDEDTPDDIPCEDAFCLTNSEKILQLMKSQLSLELIPNLGYAFFFNLHFVKVNTLADDDITTDYLEGLSALVVENVPVNRNVLSKLLKKHGVLVTTAVDGVEAVNLCDERAFDIIYMDIQMPVLDGESAAKIIRNNSTKNHSSIIIAITAHEGSEQEQRYNSIMDGCIIKPLKKNQLVKETYLAFKKSGRL